MKQNRKPKPKERQDAVFEDLKERYPLLVSWSDDDEGRQKIATAIRDLTFGVRSQNLDEATEKKFLPAKNRIGHLSYFNTLSKFLRY